MVFCSEEKDEKVSDKLLGNVLTSTVLLKHRNINFLCMSVGYIPIDIIITEEETEKDIFDGLTILKSWNPQWNPSSVVSDCDIAQSNALQKMFPGTVYHFGMFYLYTV